MSQLNATERLRRLLSIVPWIAANDGPTIDEVCTRFDIERQQLLADLDVVFMVGLYPYTPDELVDVRIEDDRVWIHYADYFRRPLRLTAEQGLALVVAGAGLLAVPGAEPEGPLARGLEKLAVALGMLPDEAVAIDLGRARPELLDELTEAARARRAVEIDYYAYGRDERTRRIVEPHRVYADKGYWYLAGHCRRADGDRVFRIDRIHDLVVLDERFDRADDESELLGAFFPNPDDPRVTIELGPGGRWITEQYPVESIEEVSEERWRVVLAITAKGWLERLLLRLGPESRVVEADAELATCGTDAARRVLDRYRRSSTDRA